MKVFYLPGARYAFDEVIEKAGREIGKWSGRTLDQCREEHPELVCISKEECVAKIIELAIRPPQEITEAAFLEMRDILPPCAWTRSADKESFHISEFDVFDITGIFVRIGARHFMMKNSYALTHEERIALVRFHFPDI